MIGYRDQNTGGKRSVESLIKYGSFSMRDLSGGGKQLVWAGGAEHVRPAVRRLGKAPAHDTVPVEQELAYKLCPVGRRHLRLCVCYFVAVLAVEELRCGIRVHGFRQFTRKINL